ncbi:Cyclin-C [Orchesella cincta]|uniref:Cyclin-C n=1 Tax=Orchesella cincta TaxID=48709 RepID=A0A1D2M4Y4_ORCCI|nr:Cyclin-C [Orchesella cincta]
MAGNFWQSSHCQQWIVDRQDLIRERQKRLAVHVRGGASKDINFLCNFMQTLGEQLKLRQQVIATASVYFKRFYARNSLKCIDPLLLAPTAIFLASKVEEFGVIFQFPFGYHMSSSWYVNNTNCSLYSVQDLLVKINLPYRPLVHFVQDMGYEEQLLPTAWRMVNDSLRTDTCLLYPPYQIALACLMMACVVMQKDTKSWFADIGVDMEKIQEICRYILSFYDLTKNYDEKEEVQALLAKMPKPKTQPSRPPSSQQPQDPNNSSNQQQDQNVNQNQQMGMTG